MLRFKILSATNVMILTIMAGGNFIFGLVSYFQEFGKMDCVRQAIYDKITENSFLVCLNGRGLLDPNGITWIYIQFILIIISIVATAFIERNKK
ncbi:MAG: hypothetical protein KGI27_05410 [Thaumarchaeota archaeon]|nr:hypothetical protein [Nitrososphaerota archaeon]